MDREPPHELVIDVQKGTWSEQKIATDAQIGFMKRNPGTYEGATILFPELGLGGSGN